MIRIRAVVFVALVLGFPSRVSAQEAAPRGAPREKLNLEYRAPPECPDATRFRQLVRSRFPADWEALPDELARRVDVVVTGSPSGYVATLELLDERGRRVARWVQGSFCPGVVDGIALIAALAIESREAEVLELSEPASDANSPPTLADPPPMPAPPALTQAPPVPNAPASHANPPHTPVEPQGEAPPVRVRTSARVAIETGIGPKPAPGAELGVLLEWRRARLGLALQGFWTGNVQAHGVPAHFELFAARLEGCPFAPELARRVSLEPCAFADLGSITGEAYEDPPFVVRGFPGSALWSSAGAAGRVVVRLSVLTLELDARVGVSLKRERFTLEGGDELHRVPPFYGALTAGVGVRF